MKELRCIDLFAGAGGLSYGFKKRGFNIVGAIEKEKAFFEAHKYNFPSSASMCVDIRDVSPEQFEKEAQVGKRSLDLIMGGPPCQTFSTIGVPKIKSLKNGDIASDPRNYLYRSFFQYIEYYSPPIFLMENVPALKTKFRGQLFRNMLDLAHSLGYETHAKVLNSVDYGVPQKRKRLFIVGTKKGIEFSFPNPTHYWSNYKEQIGPSLLGRGDYASLRRAPTVHDAISDLPRIQDGNRVDELPYSKNDDLSDYQRMMRNESGFVRNNICRVSNDRAKKVFRYMKQGSKYMDLPREIRSILPFREDIFLDRLKRLDQSKPSWTVLAHIGMDGYMYIHPTEMRTLSVREAARIQGFHDSFIFSGNMREQYREVGNAVPPLLAGKLADSVATALEGTNA